MIHLSKSFLATTEKKTFTLIDHFEEFNDILLGTHSGEQT